MGVSKVVYGENTLVDLTADTVTAETLAEGATAHDSAGNAVTGTNPYAKEETDNTVNEQEQLIEEIVTALAERCVVTEPILQSKTVTPSKEEQTVTPDAGYDGLSSVTVEAAQSGEGTYGWKKCVSSLPSGYTEVEYLQSTGTQYIDTGFKPNNNTRLTADFEVLSTTGTWLGVFGARDSSLANCFSLFVAGASNNNANKFYPNVGGKTGTAYISPSSDMVGRHTADVNKNVVTIDSITNTFTATSFQNTVTALLFAINESGTASYLSQMRFYSCQIYDNGTLVRDFVPCTNASGTAGLYDLVNDVFYGNAGSGTFAVGASTGGSVVGYVVSDDANAYPDGDYLDGYYYEKLAA